MCRAKPPHQPPPAGGLLLPSKGSAGLCVCGAFCPSCAKVSFSRGVAPLPLWRRSRPSRSRVHPCPRPVPAVGVRSGSARVFVSSRISSRGSFCRPSFAFEGGVHTEALLRPAQRQLPVQHCCAPHMLALHGGWSSTRSHSVLVNHYSCTTQASQPAGFRPHLE